ncbi:hypothetical protein OEZ85_002401 [Tetradesmus obliquus]|uniref:AB hydrolase-1 domain-containing protein n=1 Tax=Tetradesmus obliquus TaxID=3088 RepID=A0ABY8U552_TETOB|nr:hypothetical protein OEZ85_002401 [Tetradesmus obliquus]
MEVLKPLLGSSFRSQPAINALLQHFLGYAGKPLDLLYSRIGGLNGRFFPDGWGNLGIVNLKEDIDLIKQGAWASEGIKVEWKLLQQGSWEGVPYKLYEGSYRTPCVNRIYDALPAESRRGRVQLLMPAAGLGATQLQRGIQPLFSGRHTPAAVLHLAATGDHGFSRRLRLAAPLLQQGVCQLVHESPYYGARRPPQQRGSKLCAVSDLLALGWATIYESLCLLGWLEAEGVTQRGICGLSMGGVHASMTAGLYPRPLAITPLLTPRSAAVAYCDGALAPLMAWRALLQERDVADNEVERVVAAAARPVSLLHRARYVRLQQLEQQLEMVEGSRELWQQQQQQQQFSAELQREEANGLLAALGADAPPADTFRRLRHVLETYTDVTRYPTPVRPDAAVLVAARHDGYVDMASVQALQAHWPGSELRLVARLPVRPWQQARCAATVSYRCWAAPTEHWPGSELRLVDGGHVSAFLLHQEAFRAALRDSLARLEAGAPPAGA